MISESFPKENRENAKDALESLIVAENDFGFEQYAIGIDFQDFYPSEMACSYPAEWQKRYFGNEYASIDPVIRFGLMLRKPFTRDFLRKDKSLFGQTVMGEAADFGLLEGLVIPIALSGHKSILSVAGSTDKKADKLAVSATQKLAHRLAVACNGIKHNSAPVDSLSPTQLATLQLLADGYTQYETATQFRKSKDAVKQTIDILLRKFDAKNTTAFVAMALRYKLVE